MYTTCVLIYFPIFSGLSIHIMYILIRKFIYEYTLYIFMKTETVMIRVPEWLRDKLKIRSKDDNISIWRLISLECNIEED